MKRETQGMLLGLIGVMIFSLTLPMTRIVVAEFSPLLNGLGRALVASTPAAALLAIRREKLPTWPQLKALAVVSLGVIIAFPVFSAWAMKSVPASHGAVVNGLQPLCVAIYAAWLSHERPSKSFWASAIAGSAIVVAFALQAGGGAFQAGDLLMLVAVGIGALGYAEGARLARQMGGWQVICWALVLSLPVMVPLALTRLPASFGEVSSPAWLGLAYVSLFSMLIGFFFWYRGLALGGIAAVGQLQLLQPFFSLALAATLLHETVSAAMLVVTSAVVACVVGARKFSRP